MQRCLSSSTLSLEGQVLTSRDNFRPDHPGGHTREIYIKHLTNYPSSTISLSSHRLWLEAPDHILLFLHEFSVLCWSCHNSQSSEPLLLVTYFPWVSPVYTKGKHVNHLRFPFLLLICLLLQGSLPKTQKGRGNLLFPPYDVPMIHPCCVTCQDPIPF